MTDKNIYEQRKERIENYIHSAGYIPLKSNELALMLDVPANEMHTFIQILEELVNEGSVIKTKKERYMTPKSLDIHKGVYTNTGKGFGFVFMQDGNDIYVPENLEGTALHTDEVLVKITEKLADGRKRGEIIKVVKRNLTQLTGTFTVVKNYGFVIPDNSKIGFDLFIGREDINNAESGNRVTAKIIKWEKGMKNPIGRIKEILGDANDPQTNVLALIKQYELPLQFPSACIAEANLIEDQIDEKELIGRTDLRGETIITIDGADAKDLDDAVSIKRLSNGNFSLGVHIADVTHYVKEKSQIDREAFKRGTSVYFADRVIPMLPQKLSNGICSLHPSVDRLTLSCVMEISRSGEVVSYQILESVINSAARMTYDDVSAILEKTDTELLDKYSDLIELFTTMKELSNIIRSKRKRRGAIDFDFTECKVKVDESGKPLEIKPYERNIAMNIIEDFMLLCNETIAEDAYWLELPFIFRSHETPDSAKIEILSKFISNFGYSLPYTNEVHPKALQKILEKSKSTPHEHIIKRVALRALKQARYTEKNGGHFGLAAKYYCHFTSPIRRYPDLQIHRVIKENLRGMTQKRTDNLTKRMPEVASESSLKERIAEEAEREVLKLKKAEYMNDKIGESFAGIVSGVTSWGIYVELENTIEGLVSVYTIDYQYDYDDKKMEYISLDRKSSIRIGDAVTVKVKAVNLLNRTIDFEMLYSDTHER